MYFITIILFSLLLDLFLAELPSSIHPVVFMGKLIDLLKPKLLKYRNKASGVVITIISLTVFLLIFYLILEMAGINIFLYIFVSAFLLFTTFAIRGLLSSAGGVMHDIDSDISKARTSVSYLVSRDTNNLSREELVSATVESLTENITDSVVSPLFYAFILSIWAVTWGVLGAVAYRVINTLDAMVGYKNLENIYIGWFPANLDDILNYLPARITGLFIILASALMGLPWRKSYQVMMRDAQQTPSPNSGYPMAAAAGALGIQLKKKGHYQLGDPVYPLQANTISDALILTKITIILFIGFSTLIYIILTAIIV
jgi:adenosylcobinamide-phosphate synthase